jgi:peptidoglycan-associated lipoprotein
MGVLGGGSTVSLDRPRLFHSFLVFFVVVGLTTACGGKKRPPATVEIPPSPAPETTTPPPPPPPERESAPERTENTLSRMEEDADILSMTLDEINAQSPLNDIRFDYDSAALTPGARSELESHAQWLRRFRSVTVLIEGHCDERGTVEYNLALGERRAMAAYNYLMSLGVAGDQLKTISYGKEFPLDPEHTESAWARNRRCHFVITAK